MCDVDGDLAVDELFSISGKHRTYEVVLLPFTSVSVDSESGQIILKVEGCERIQPLKRTP